MPYDLFISYLRSDNAEDRITQLGDRIKADFASFAHRDLVPFFDHQEIRGMQDWKQRIWRGLANHACYSPVFLRPISRASIASGRLSNRSEERRVGKECRARGA